MRPGSYRGLHECWQASWGKVAGVTLGAGMKVMGEGMVGAKEWLTNSTEMEGNLGDKVAVSVR